MWSWVLTTIGLTGFVLAGKKKWYAWYINIANQILWFTYAVVTDQYGFIVASLAYTVVFTQNAIKWTNEHRIKNSNVLVQRRWFLKSHFVVDNDGKKHVYLSTYCIHSLHESCRLVCKTCTESCQCDCHFQF